MYVCRVLHYVTPLYIICILYKCVVYAPALLDCLVASFVDYTQIYLQTRSGCLYRHLIMFKEMKQYCVNFTYARLSPILDVIKSRD